MIRKTPYPNIYNILRINRFIVIMVVGTSFIISVISGGFIYKIHKEALENAFAIGTDGAIIPLKWQAQKENLEVEALAQLELFHRYFYHIDPASYQKNLGKALWLGDSSVDQLYRQKKAEGVYNRILQYSLVQKVLSVRSELDLLKAPYAFKTATIFEINRGSSVDTYELVTTGELIRVQRSFPNNAHGLLITNYFENTLKQIPNESKKK